MDFYLRRLHSILGVIPLFVFVPVHMLQKAIPFFTFNFKEGSILLLILAGIGPFALHALIGIYIIVQNGGVRRKTKGILFRLQIISSVLILLYVPAHIYIFNALRYIGGYTIFASAYMLTVLGISALAYHIGYGSYTFCITWGLCVKAAALKRLRIITAFLGFVFGFGGIILFTFVFISIKGMLGL